MRRKRSQKFLSSDISKNEYQKRKTDQFINNDIDLGKTYKNEWRNIGNYDIYIDIKSFYIIFYINVNIKKQYIIYYILYIIIFQVFFGIFHHFIKKLPCILWIKSYQWIYGKCHKCFIKILCDAGINHKLLLCYCS